MNTELQKTLQKKFGFWEHTAEAFIESKGLCGYCGENLYETRVQYYSMQLDHLLPKNTYVHLATHPQNFVLSCQRCNNLKRAFNPLKENEDSEEMLENNKSKLISRVKEHLKEKIEKDEKILSELHELISW